MLEAAGVLGIRPQDIFAMTVPELALSLRGWQRAKGLDPDDLNTDAPMSRARLLELIKKEF